MMDLKIGKKNEVYLRVEAPDHVKYELADFFTFEVESAKYMQKTKRYRGWDGKIRLFSPATGELYVGLVDYLTDWAKKNNLIYKLIAIRPKWGLDFSIDYVDNEGNAFEIFHWEFDGFDFLPST